MTIKRENIIGKKRPTPVKKLDPLPGIDGDLYVRRITPKEVVQVEHIFRENAGKPENWQARFAVLFASDENGNRIFTDADAVEIGADGSLTDMVETVVDVGTKFNGMNKAAREAAKKNLPPTQAD